jgi:hypothetical protein
MSVLRRTSTGECIPSTTGTMQVLQDVKVSGGSGQCKKFTLFDTSRGDVSKTEIRVGNGRNVVFCRVEFSLILGEGRSISLTEAAIDGSHPYIFIRTDKGKDVAKHFGEKRVHCDTQNAGRRRRWFVRHCAIGYNMVHGNAKQCHDALFFAPMMVSRSLAFQSWLIRELLPVSLTPFSDATTAFGSKERPIDSTSA